VLSDNQKFRSKEKTQMWACHTMLIILAVALAGCDNPETMSDSKNNVEHINPNGLHANPAYSQAVAVGAGHKTLYVGGQNAVSEDGTVVGQGDLKTQTAKALSNLELALKAAGGDLSHVVKWNVYVVEGQSALEGFAAFREVWGQRPNPPAITLAFVAGLANAEYLVEVDAVAAIPE
jgi:enamine deaminase RidA (YjgF/YER057c/UK114 family)